jgi:hypothetical protein
MGTTMVSLKQESNDFYNSETELKKYFVSKI